MTSAGGKLQENVINFLKKYCEKKGILFYVMYGQTEASPRISYYKLNKTNLYGASTNFDIHKDCMYNFNGIRFYRIIIYSDKY